ADHSAEAEHRGHYRRQLKTARTRVSDFQTAASPLISAPCCGGGFIDGSCRPFQLRIGGV
ncbi:MAG: hypothetical protein AAEJ43_01260, partial [Gammaproteobacteria bacterium]